MSLKLRVFYLIPLLLILTHQSVAFRRDSLNMKVATALTIREDTNAVKLYNEISADYQFHLENNDSFQVWNNKALALADRLHYKAGLGDAYYNFATFQIRLNDYQEGADYLLKAVEIYSVINYPLGIAKVYMQQSILHYTQKNYKLAISTIDEALEIIRKHKLPQYTNLIYLKGVYLVDDNRPTEALPFLNEALSVRTAEENESKIMECRLYLAVALEKLGQDQKAEEYFRLARNTATKTFNEEALGYIHLKEGEFHLARKQYKEAEEHLSKSLDLTLNANRHLIAQTLLARIFFETGRTELAYLALRDYAYYKDSIDIAKSSGQIAALRTRSDIIQKENEIVLLEQKRRNERLVNYGLAIVSLLVLSTAIISYKRFTFKRDANQKLSRANQELMQTLEDLKLAEQQLLQAEKMASLGRVTAGIAHELRNPLNFIHNFAAVASESVDDFLQADSTNKEEIAKDLKTSIEKIKFHGNKAEQIITTMLKHGKEKILDTDDVSLDELIHESINIATKNFGFKHEGFQCKVGIDTLPEEFRIRVNPKSIPLVIGNLIDNAMYSVMQKSKSSQNGYEPEVNLHIERDVNGLLLEIKDNGIGLNGINANEIFEPFYTTKPTGHGTGLGLSICYEILKAHGASIQAKSNTVGGVTFSILFPNTLIIN